MYKKYFLISAMIFLLGAFLLGAGCLGGQQPAAAQAAPAYAPPSGQAPSGAQPPVAQPPQQVAPQSPNAGSQSCPGLSGKELVDCTYARAVEQKDVSVCTAIDLQEGRFSCIAQWCGSLARDYYQCSNLANYDDRTGCLNKCNPNSNT